MNAALKHPFLPILFAISIIITTIIYLFFSTIRCILFFSLRSCERMSNFLQSAEGDVSRYVGLGFFTFLHNRTFQCSKFRPL